MVRRKEKRMRARECEQKLIKNNQIFFFIKYDVFSLFIFFYSFNFNYDQIVVTFKSLCKKKKP